MTIDEVTTAYANVHWYEKAVEDNETMLLTCKTDTHGSLMYPAIPVDELPQPLITAEEDGLIYALDFLDQKRMEDLLDWMDNLPAQR